MRNILNASILAVVVVACAGVDADQARREPILGGPCEGCEWVFEGMPATLDSLGRIAPQGEKGEPMRIRGTVRDQKKQPVAGVIVYAYQTDAGGIYPSGQNRHGRLKGWVRTDATGQYQFDTIRPGGYPNTTIQQHVHMHVIEPGKGTYYIDELVFSDDPRLTPALRQQVVTGRGGDGGVATPKKDASGVWQVTRDIVLGQGIPGYPR